MSSTVIINGKTIRIDGDCNNVCVNNNKVYVNGKLIQDCDEIKEKNIKITIDGNVGSIETGSADVIVNGDCSGDVKAGSGDITVKGNVSGGINTGSGDVECGNVGGSVKTGSGDVKCKSVENGVSTMSGKVSKSHEVIPNSVLKGVFDLFNND